MLTSFELKNAASLCAHAFFYDNLDTYFFPNELDRKSKQILMYRYFLGVNQKNIHVGPIYTDSLAVIEKPYCHSNDFSIKDISSCFPLLNFGINTLKRMISFQYSAVRIQRGLVKDPFWYLRMVVVAQELRGKGYASKLLRPQLEKAEESAETFFLETHNERNIPIYEKLGFKVINSRRIENTKFNHYCMIK